MTTWLRLLCHAATPATRASGFPADEPLEPRARDKLAAGTWSLPADRAWTSPALRASQTAEALGLDAAAEPALRECDYGRWAGRSFEAVQAEAPEAVAEWMGDPGAAPHGGESLLDVMARVGAWLDAQGGTPGHVVAVTHASVIRAAILHAIEAGPRSFWRIDVAPLCLVKLSGHAGRWTLGSIAPLAPGRAAAGPRPEQA